MVGQARRPAKAEASPSAAAVKRRDEIVTRSAALFDEEGYHLTSMDDIARAVGLAKPTLYHYFRSKDSILLAIHEEIITLLLNRQRERELTDRADPADQLYDVMFDIIDLMRTHPGHVRTYFEYRRELPEEAQVEAQQARNNYFLSVRKIFEKGMARGRFRGDPQLSTITLFSLCNSVYTWFGDNEPYTVEDATAYFHSALMDGIVPR